MDSAVKAVTREVGSPTNNFQAFTEAEIGHLKVGEGFPIKVYVPDIRPPKFDRGRTRSCHVKVEGARMSVVFVVLAILSNG